MRPLYIDVNGATDANGNASIPVTMPRMTGRWHNAKFTLGTTAPAEWAVLVNGRPYTYGRGRRVTLGPELIQDGQTASVSVIGGPAKAVVDGTVTGISGTPDEIMATYTPAPNTIALDAFNTSSLIGTINNVGSSDSVGPRTIQLPGGSQGVGFAVSGVSPNQTPSSVTIRGTQTALPYVAVATNPVAWAAELFPEDSSVDVTVVGNPSAVPSVTFIHAYTYNPRVRFQGSTPNNGPLWQVPQQTVPISTGGIANGAAVTILAGVPDFQVFPHWFYLTGNVAVAQSMQILLRDTTNHTTIADLAAPSAVFNILNNGDFKGASSPIPIGAGLELFNNTGGGAGITCMGWLGFSQG